MPAITRWFVKTALGYFIAALLVGIGLAARTPLHLDFLPPGLGPVYLHLFVVGWISQLIFGVVIWMFPKYTREKPRGMEEVSWVVYVLLNLGLVLRAVGEPLAASRPGALSAWLLILSALLQWLAGLGFVANTWARVKEK
jgi:hypothetical protein